MNRDLSPNSEKPAHHWRAIAQQGARMSADRDAERAHKHAAAAVRRGDLAAAERWSKSAECLAALPLPAEQVVDHVALRAELRRRLAL
jgi:hypothetical protein